MERIQQPQNERSRRTRSAVLDAAWDLLAEVGAERTTMGAVAERAGVSRRALYLHFASRGELLLALHEHVDTRLDLEASVRPVYEATDAAAALNAFVDHLVRYHSPIMEIDLALLSAGDDPDVAAVIEQGSEIWHSGCLKLAQRIQDEGRLAEPWTVQTAADLLWSVMFPETMKRLTGDRGWTWERYRELLTAVITRSLLRP